MRSMTMGLVAAAVLAFALVSGGCGGARMGRYDLRVSMDPALANMPGGAPAVTVNLVGVNESALRQWNEKDMGEYWRPNDPLRADAESKYAYVMQFGPGRPTEQVLKKDDPIWDRWQNATHLFVLADLPGAFESKPGSADARRRELPLDRNRWRGDVIEVELQRSSVFIKTPIVPEKK